MSELCEKAGCNKLGILCSLNDDEDTEFRYCAKHCYENGFCFGCGNFFSGSEDFDFNNPSHLCFNCRSEVDEDIEDEEIATELSEFDEYGPL